MPQRLRVRHAPARGRCTLAVPFEHLAVPFEYLNSTREHLAVPLSTSTVPVSTLQYPLSPLQCPSVRRAPVVDARALGHEQPACQPPSVPGCISHVASFGATLFRNRPLLLLDSPRCAPYDLRRTLCGLFNDAWCLRVSEGVRACVCACESDRRGCRCAGRVAHRPACRAQSSRG